MLIDFIDVKVSVWKRIKVSSELSDAQLDTLRQFLGTNPDPHDASEYLKEIGLGNCSPEFLIETEEPMTIEDNAGGHTVEFFNDQHELITTNKD